MSRKIRQAACYTRWFSSPKRIPSHLPPTVWTAFDRLGFSYENAVMRELLLLYAAHLADMVQEIANTGKARPGWGRVVELLWAVLPYEEPSTKQVGVLWAQCQRLLLGVWCMCDDPSTRGTTKRPSFVPAWMSRRKTLRLTICTLVNYQDCLHREKWTRSCEWRLYALRQEAREHPEEHMRFLYLPHGETTNLHGQLMGELWFMLASVL
mmetsp:Transcript_23488/g.59340  ORF Transcript_23488/g.59340 Transcript_23488/m.59340 type:complete len:209 (-) Transcript_23488:164-790(-)